MTVTLLVFYIIADMAALAWGYRTEGFAQVSPLWLVFGSLWLFATWRKIAVAAAFGLLATVAAAGVGVLLGLSPAWMLAGTMCGLIAWDLTRFRERLSLEYFEADLGGMEHRHLLRISLLCVILLTLTSIVMAGQQKISVDWVLLLAVMTAVAVIQFLHWYRSSK